MDITKLATKSDLDGMITKQYDKLIFNIKSKSFKLKNYCDDELASEILSSTYIKVLKKIEENKLYINTLENYFGLSTYNLLIDTLKKNKKTNDIHIDIIVKEHELEYIESTEVIDDTENELLQLNSILQWVDTLTTIEQLIFIQKNLNNLSYQKIADQHKLNYRALIKTGHELESKIKEKYGYDRQRVN